MATALAKAKGNSISRVNKSWLGKQVRDGRQDQHQGQVAEPSRDGGPRALADGSSTPRSTCGDRTRCCTHERSFDVAEIFKKTPCVADLKPGGRYVAKDMYEVGGIPLLMKTLLDNGQPHGDCMTVTGRTIAENLKSVKWNPRRDLARAGDHEIDAEVGTLNVKLTDAELAEHKTKWKAPRD